MTQKLVSILIFQIHFKRTFNQMDPNQHSRFVCFNYRFRLRFRRSLSPFKLNNKYHLIALHIIYCRQHNAAICGRKGFIRFLIFMILVIYIYRIYLYIFVFNHFEFLRYLIQRNFFSSDTCFHTKSTFSFIRIIIEFFFSNVTKFRCRKLLELSK